MNTKQLEQYMLSDPYIKQYYGGVLAVDQLPIIVNKPEIYIVNTDPISKPGTHWVTLFVDTICEHFDSAGLPPREDFMTFLTLNGPSYIYNSNRVQHFKTNSCGLYCLFYSYFRCRGYSFKKILEMFKDNLILNEMIVKIFYELTR